MVGRGRQRYGNPPPGVPRVVADDTPADFLRSGLGSVRNDLNSSALPTFQNVNHMAFNVGLDVLDAEVESANGVATHLSSYMTYMLCRELGSSISAYHIWMIVKSRTPLQTNP